MENKQLISVVIPAYNVEQYIEDCIDSVRNQTHDQLEIIIVDDGSTDSTGRKCDNKATLDNRIKVIHKPNGGLSSARNAGIDNASGDYICFVDGDDIVHPEFAERLLSAIDKADLDCAYCEFEKFDDKASFHNSDIHHDSFLYNRNEVLMMLADVENKSRVTATLVWNKLYKKDLFNNLRFINGKIHEDEFIIHRVIGKCTKIGYLNFPGYYYRTRSDSITGNWNNYSLRHLDVIDAYSDRLDYIKTLENDELTQKMTISMCEIILMEYLSFFKNSSLKKPSSVPNLNIEQFLRNYIFMILRKEHSHISPRNMIKYIIFIFSPATFYKKYWHIDTSTS